MDRELLINLINIEIRKYDGVDDELYDSWVEIKRLTQLGLAVENILDK